MLRYFSSWVKMLGADTLDKHQRIACLMLSFGDFFFPVIKYELVWNSDPQKAV